MEKKKPSKKRMALGKGLSALLEDSNYESREKLISDAARLSSINEIPLDHIKTNPFQPRAEFDRESLEELAASIKAQGIIQPITVRKAGKDEYQLISGERRLLAAEIAGLEKIPTYIRQANDQQMLELALIENIHRENLNSIEIALSYQRLITECKLKQEELGDRVGKKRTTVNNYLRLLKLPPDIQAALRDNKLSMGHARALITVENIDQQLSIFNRIIHDDLSVRKVEELVRKFSQIKPLSASKGAKEHPLPSELRNLQSTLSSHFGTKIDIRPKGDEKGEIKIPYYSHEDLNRILDILEIKL